MSGYKRATVTISEQEYRRLHQADMKRRFGEHGRPRAKNGGQEAELSSTLQQMAIRQRQLEDALGALNQDLPRIESETMQSILVQNAQWYERLAGVIEETNSSLDDSFAAISQHFSERMQEERQHYRRGLQSLSQQLDAYRHKEQAKEQLARQWLRRSVILSEFMQGQFDHERFQPGRLSRIHQRLDFAQENLAAGSPDASLQLSQQVFLELSELHFELEQCVLEWQAEYERAQNAMNELLAELQLNSQVTAFDLQGEALPGQVDLDYWTKGKYRQVLDRCQQFVTLLADEQQRLSTAELKRIYTDVLPVISGFFDSIVYEARLNALNSQLRLDIAERALEALEMHGFQLNDSGYNQKDMRASFTAHLENSDGSQVTIEVLPIDIKTQELANELVVITKHPYLKTEQEARMQWEELCRTFSQYNLQVSRPEIHPATPATTHNSAETLALSKPQRVQSEIPGDVR